jgi:formate-dependent nitrite reductase membrane component NrfD
VSPSTERSYYGQAVLKEPEWTWEVPWYLFSGGLAGASAGLAFGTRLSGRPGLAATSRLVTAAGAAVSPVLLVMDLGRPRRFYNMLRVFKPTSAMSMGSWLLSAFVPAAVGSAALGALGVAPRLQRLAEGTAAVLGLPMCTYTAVLLADSSVPVWHEARHELPFVFASSAAASAGAVTALLVPFAESGPARRLAVAGALGELAAVEVMKRRLGGLARPYEEPDAGRWARAATASTAVGAALVALGGGRQRPAPRPSGPRRETKSPRSWGQNVGGRVGAALVVVGGICQRWAVFRAGFASAADPSYVVGPQRERRDARPALP